jgi:hypothetical protein
MLIEGLENRTRVQCAGCGAHALLRPEDYDELKTDHDGWMRCEVCGIHGRFEPTGAAAPAVLSLAAWR